MSALLLQITMQAMTVLTSGGVPPLGDFILLETGDRLLQETGDRIKLESSV